MRWSSLVVVAGLLGVAACDCGSSGTGSDDAGRMPRDGTSSCISLTECPVGEICDPVMHECVPEPMMTCTMHSDCGAVGICVDGTCESNTPGGPCDTTEDCISTETCTGGRCGCGGARYGAEGVPPNMLIVLDRSGSMNNAPDGGGGPSKWDIARDAIRDLVATYGDQVRFGLYAYPGFNRDCSMGARCDHGDLAVDVGEMTAMPITTYLNRAQTCMFSTPTAEALRPQLTYMGLKDTERANYVMLITDGMSTCDDPIPVVRRLRMETPEIKTFAIGFGGEVDAMELTQIANAGGTARAGTPAYYQADDAASLADAFDSIAGAVLSCTYTLSETPPDPDFLFVYVDRMEVMRDPSHAGGWDYDPATNQITFYGSECDTLKMAGELVIQYGCPVDIF